MSRQTPQIDAPIPIQPTDYDPVAAAQELSSSSPLDTPESTDRGTSPWRFPESPPTGEEPVDTFRHSGWKNRRTLVSQALADDYHNARRRGRFNACGASFWLLRNLNDPTLFKRVPDFCRDRWCVPCARSRAAHISANLLPRLNNAFVRFLTLTLARDDRSLRERITRLTSSFTKLRKRPFWQAHVCGGAAFLEVTRGANGDHWHPHLHIIATGAFLPRDQLAQEWLHVTGDSHVVDVRAARDSKQVASYVTSYVTKPAQAAILRDPDALREAIAALKGRKLLHAFGDWSTWKLLANPSTEGWIYFGHLSEVIRLADAGDELAANVLITLEYLGHAHTETPFHVDSRSPP